MEQSVEYNSLEKFKVKASLTLPILFAHISDFFLNKKKKKKEFSENPASLDMEIFLLSNLTIICIYLANAFPAFDSYIRNVLHKSQVWN